jgi:hypothetical protein
MSGLLGQIRFVVPAFAVTLVCALPGTAMGDSATGGASPTDPEFQPHGTAMLLPTGQAIAPDDAPPEVKAIVDAGNRIATLPYRYGGGHKLDFRDSAYDCSGSVSFALHGGGLLTAPLDSSSFMSWGDKGPGSWITIYTNPGHAFMVVAGLRFDTSMRTPLASSARHSTKTRSGHRVVRTLTSRWSSTMRPADGYKVRHPVGF